MEFYAVILARILVEAGAAIVIGGEDSELMLEKMVEMRCCQALSDIQEILKDDTLSDEECFLRIERIVALYEELGPGAGGHHDFG